MQQDRYCRNCGQELQPEDRFCANCGSPVHATTTVPTPEADVSVPPLPQAEPDPQPPQTAEQAATVPRRWSAIRSGTRSRTPRLSP